MLVLLYKGCTNREVSVGREANKPSGVTTVTTTQARRNLPQLARRAAQQRKPGKTLVEKAVRIKPQGAERAAYLVAEVDVEETERYIEELEDVLEDIEFISLLEQRTGDGDGAPSGQPLSEVIQEFAQAGLLTESDLASIAAVGAEQTP